MHVSIILARAAAVFLLPAALLPLSLAEEPKSEARRHLDQIRTEIRAAHAAGDNETYVAKSRDMQDLLNSSPNSILQLMSAQAVSGDRAAALSSFERFISLGQSNPQAFANKAFDDLRQSPQFAALESKMRQNETPIARGSAVFRLPEPGLVPEDIGYDPAGRLFYITSVLKHQILALDMKGHFRVFARAPDAWPMMGLKIDPRHRTLWATEVAMRGFASIPQAQWKTSVILIYDLDSGRLLHRIDGPPKTTLGDMTLTSDGDAIVSDNDGGAIFRIHSKTLAIDRLDSGEFISPQTPALSPDGRRLFVPDYLRGIGILDLATRKVSWLATEGLHALDGIDGLYLEGRTLVATQNGTSPERVIRFELDPSYTRIESESILERATPTLGDPTHGVIVNGTFYYIAGSGWDSLEDDGTLKAGAKPTPALFMRVDLK